jgi:ATP-dependent Lon protease
MPEGNLPLFPLDLVLYPGETIPLHIFEPRYKAMVNDCLSGDRAFGVVLVDGGELSDVGCVAEIRKILKRYPDGRLDISVQGRARFRVEEVDHEGAYMTARVAEVSDATELVDRNSQQRVIAQHMRLLELVGRDVSPSAYEGVENVSFFIARNAGLTLTQKQSILEIRSEADRISYLVSFLESFIPQVERVDSLRKKIGSNGHFKDFPAGLGGHVSE